MKNLVILGSARTESNTSEAIKKHCPFSEYDLVDLRTLNIRSYDYDSSKNTQDDFLMVAEKMAIAENIVFATPVYWYAMSGVMKVFFDRLTDLLYLHKPIGKALKGKKVYLIATGSELELPEGFEVPFKCTSEYFEMVFVKSIYIQCD